MCKWLEVDRSQIQCVVFDAVGTLIEATPSVADAYQMVGARYGSRLDRDEIKRRFGIAFQEVELKPTEIDDRHATNEQNERERWRQIVGRVLDDVTDLESCFNELWDHFSQPQSWLCFKDARVISQLRDSGLQVAIASNFDSRLNAVCDGLPELAAVKTRVISSTVGFQKPSPQFFEALLAIVGRQPHEVLFVGDDLENDVHGPRQVGIAAVHLDRRAETIGPRDSSSIQSLDELISLR